MQILEVEGVEKEKRGVWVESGASGASRTETEKWSYDSEVVLIEIRAETR